MSVIRVNKTKDYSVMSNYHFKDKRISLKAKGLLSQMLSLPDNWNYSILGLIAINKENETAIKSALDELKENNYLTITKLTPDKTKSGRLEYIYDIYETPKQDSEKQGVENLGVENQGQLNTNDKVSNNYNTNNKNKINKESLYSLVERNFGRTLSPLEYEEISQWEDNEITRYAIKEAVLRRALNIKYINAIIRDCEAKGIKTINNIRKEETSENEPFLFEYDWLEEE